ncbi:uncharacterized protein J3D65DRAFT_695772 [Phyllosticta citribraziliensis]|uniref:Uncharacterized protein n=1 Tax=Phyllosticta citribraziliensis TaxID=989973 RepID=A0ABR1LNZ2_9PEZI
MAEQALIKSEALTDATEDLNTQSVPTRDEVDCAREEREEEKLEVEWHRLRYERLAKLAGLKYADAISRVKEIDKKSCYYPNPDRPDYTELCNSGKKVETLKGMLRALISGSRVAEKEHWQVCLAMVGNRWDRRRVATNEDSLAEQYKELMAGFDKINENIANTGVHLPIQLGHPKPQEAFGGHQTNIPLPENFRMFEPECRDHDPINNPGTVVELNNMIRRARKEGKCIEVLRERISEEKAHVEKLVVPFKTAGKKLAMLDKELVALKKVDEEVKKAAKLKREVFWPRGFRDILQIMEEASSALVKVGMAKLLEGKN